MEREEFKTLVKGMKAVYAQPTFIPDQDAFNIWFELLKDLPYQQINIAIQKYMLTEKFPPTIADIRAKASDITAKPEESMGELEAWALVHKAICNSGYHAEEEFAKLPEACRKAVGNPSNLREWAAMETDQVSTVEQSHFIRNYRAAVQRMNEDAKLPGNLKTLIENMRTEVVPIEQKPMQSIETTKAEEEPLRIGVPMPQHVAEKLHELYKEFGRTDNGERSNGTNDL